MKVWTLCNLRIIEYLESPYVNLAVYKFRSDTNEPSINKTPVNVYPAPHLNPQAGVVLFIRALWWNHYSQINSWFYISQIVSGVMKSKKVYRWSPGCTMIALSIFYHSGKTYALLSQNHYHWTLINAPTDRSYLSITFSKCLLSVILIWL